MTAAGQERDRAEERRRARTPRRSRRGGAESRRASAKTRASTRRAPRANTTVMVAERGAEPEPLLEKHPRARDRLREQELERSGLPLACGRGRARRDHVRDQRQRQHQAEQLGLEISRGASEAALLDAEEREQRLGIVLHELLVLVAHRRPDREHRHGQQADTDAPPQQPVAPVVDRLRVDATQPHRRPLGVVREEHVLEIGFVTRDALDRVARRGLDERVDRTADRRAQQITLDVDAAHAGQVREASALAPARRTGSRRRATPSPRARASARS